MDKSQFNYSSMRKMAAGRGFTLAELMITVVIVASLAAIAIPAYSGYVTRGKLADAFTGLAGATAAAEQYWSNNRTYVGFNASSAFPAATTNFTFAISNATTSTYTVTATGINKVAGFIYTVNQDGAKGTTTVGTGWSGAGSTCWVGNKDGSCVQ